VIAGHVSLDVFPRLYGPVDLEPGRLNVVGPATFSTGGVVSNTGLAMHRLGVAVRLVGKIGDDLFGRVVRDAYRELRPQLAEGLTVAATEATSYTLVINPPRRDRAYLHCPGANESFGADDVRDQHLADARLFHFGYPPLMPRMYADGGAELYELFARARTAGLITALDMCVPDPASDAGRADWVTVLKTALPAVDVFAPSIDELLFMVDRPRFDRLVGGHPLPEVVDRASLRALTDRLIAMGSAIVALKLGDHGLYVRTTSDPAQISPICERLDLDANTWAHREVLAPCFRAREIVGTTGSGDATIGGLLAAMLRGTSVIEAATTATAVGACSVESVDPTTAIPSWDELTARLEQGWARHDVEIDLGSARTDRDATGTMVLT
jgi:sugar/nucleoside kinase (ribokinase family)